MRGFAALLAVAVGLAGCSEEPAIEACEAFVLERLRSPSTYRRIESRSFIEADGDRGWARIVYDAANAYGTPIRGEQACQFDTPGGRWPERQELVHKARLAAIGGEGLCCRAGMEDTLYDFGNDAMYDVGNDTSPSEAGSAR